MRRMLVVIVAAATLVSVRPAAQHATADADSVINGERKDLEARPTDLVQAGDTITVRQRLL